ncbi:MAG: 6-pyruvoyl trahydropterin synthase family protein [Gemmatimonadaceae bacterium]
MPRAYLTRRVNFASAHRYRRPEWSDEQNEKVFGLCARPSYHGHSYVCDVTIAGEVDPVTGFAYPLDDLDRILAKEVRDRFDHRNINTDVPEFSEGSLVPTNENLARFIFDKVTQHMPGTTEVIEVRVAEDDTLSATYRGGL